MQAQGLDWRYGAQLFESLLTDHDFEVNYVNWNYFAGVGNDPRDRRFQSAGQGLKYDPDACLVGAWIPELAGLDSQHAHMPWLSQGPEGMQGERKALYIDPVFDTAVQF